MLLNVVMMEIVLSNTWKRHLRIWPIFQGDNFNVLLGEGGRWLLGLEV